MSTQGNRNHAAPNPSLDGNGYKRITNACLQCQKLKRRCNGAKPACHHCIKLKKPCQYAERRRRGPGKMKEELELLGARLRIVETSLREQHSKKTFEPESIVTQVNEPWSGNVVQTNSQVEICPPAHTNWYHASSNLTPNASFEDNAGVQPEAITQQLMNPPAYRNIVGFPELAAEISNVAQRTRAELDKVPFHQRVFVRFPSKPLVINLLQQVLGEIQFHGILLSKESIVELIDGLDVAGVKRCASGLPRWALANSLFAAAIRYKATQGSLRDIVPAIWGYFNNAFVVFPELVFQAPELSACEALMAMAMFMLGTADARVISQLTIAASRLACSLGLHRRRYYLGLEDTKSERSKRVFWFIYILNTEMMHKYGMPSHFQNEDLPVQLPSEGVVEDRTPGYYRRVAEIAVIQSRLHNLLPTGRDFQGTNGKLTEEIGSIYKELQLWKRSLPQHLQEPSEAFEGDLDMAIALLHFKYYSCVAKLHMGMSRILVFKISSSEMDHTHKPYQTFSSTEMSRGMAAASARRTIGLLSHLPLEPFSQLWEILCYPLSATLLLLSCILTNPAANQSKFDVETIGHFVKFVERIYKDDMGEGRVLNGCIRIHKIAKYAINVHEASEQPTESDDMFSGSEMREKLDSLRNKLSEVTDWLHLAQGLLCNIPMLCVEAEEVLSEIPGMESPDGVYGAFVPDFLKSHNHDFSYRT